MKDIYNFPVLAGNLSFVGKNAVLCTVSEKGETSLQSYKVKHKVISNSKIPFLRGLEYLIAGTFCFFWGLRKSFKNINKQSRNTDTKIVHSDVTKEKVNKVGMPRPLIFTLLLGIFSIFAAVIILGILPNIIGFWILSGNFDITVKKICIGVAKCLILYIALIGIYLIPSVKKFFRFNSAGNVVLSKDNDILKAHRGTNYLNFIISSLLLSYFVISLIGFTITPWLKPFANFGVMLLCFSITYEILYLFDNKLSKYKQMIMPVSWLITSKPSQTEIQTVKSAICEGKMMQKNAMREPIDTNANDGVPFSVVYAEVKDKMFSAGVGDIDEVKWLIATFLDVPKLELNLVGSITKQQHKNLQKVLERRIKGEPIAKIFGYSEFYGLPFKVDKNVLTPRQETEILVEQALKYITSEKESVLDLCTGSGAIAVAIAKNSLAKITASDISEKALSIAKQNAEENNVQIDFKQSDMFTVFKKKKQFNVIVSNPPYIMTEEIPSLQKEVREYDPTIALDGGIDGLYFYNIIANNVLLYLSPTGKLLLEIGYNQASKVKKLLTGKFNNIKIIKDYSGNERVVVAWNTKDLSDKEKAINKNQKQNSKSTKVNVKNQPVQNQSKNNVNSEKSTSLVKDKKKQNKNMSNQN